MPVVVPDKNNLEGTRSETLIHQKNKLGLEGSALTPAEVRQHLSDRGVEQELTSRTHLLLERLEATQYGAGATEPGQLEEQLKGLILELERQIKG